MYAIGAAPLSNATHCMFESPILVAVLTYLLVLTYIRTPVHASTTPSRKSTSPTDLSVISPTLVFHETLLSFRSAVLRLHDPTPLPQKAIHFTQI